MMSELRWALLILGVVFIVVLTFWERRRPRQASGALERMSLRDGGAEPAPRLVREPPLTLPEVRVREPVVAAELPVLEMGEEPAVPVLEPAAPELDAALDSPPDPPRVYAHSGYAEEPTPEAAGGPEGEDTTDDIPALVLDEQAGAHESDAGARESAADTGEAESEELPVLPAHAALLVDWPAEHERHILALRLVAPQRERFAGRSLRQALAAEGFLLGQFAIFHKPDDEQRAVLSAASLTRPGTFDMDTMDSQHYGGLSLFAVLPGPKPARQAFDELVFAARNLNERLHGVLQDEQGTPLTPARIEQLREQLHSGAES
jgi:cell division protein ZipA